MKIVSKLQYEVNPQSCVRAVLKGAVSPQSSRDEDSLKAAVSPQSSRDEDSPKSCSMKPILKAV